METGKDDPETDENSTKMATRENFSPKKDKHIDFVEWVTRFHSRKYSRRYNFKIILEATQESPEVYLAQCFQLFFTKMKAVDPNL